MGAPEPVKESVVAWRCIASASASDRVARQYGFRTAGRTAAALDDVLAVSDGERDREVGLLPGQRLGKLKSAPARHDDVR